MNSRCCKREMNKKQTITILFYVLIFAVLITLMTVKGLFTAGIIIFFLSITAFILKHRFLKTCYLNHHIIAIFILLILSTIIGLHGLYSFPFEITFHEFCILKTMDINSLGPLWTQNNDIYRLYSVNSSFFLLLKTLSLYFVSGLQCLRTLSFLSFIGVLISSYIFFYRLSYNIVISTFSSFILLISASGILLQKLFFIENLLLIALLIYATAFIEGLKSNKTIYYIVSALFLVLAIVIKPESIFTGIIAIFTLVINLFNSNDKKNYCFKELLPFCLPLLIFLFCLITLTGTKPYELLYSLYRSSIFYEILSKSSYSPLYNAILTYLSYFNLNYIAINKITFSYLSIITSILFVVGMVSIIKKANKTNTFVLLWFLITSLVIICYPRNGLISLTSFIYVVPVICYCISIAVYESISILIINTKPYQKLEISHKISINIIIYALVSAIIAGFSFYNLYNTSLKPYIASTEKEFYSKIFLIEEIKSYSILTPGITTVIYINKTLFNPEIDLLSKYIQLNYPNIAFIENFKGIQTVNNTNDNISYYTTAFEVPYLSSVTSNTTPLYLADNFLYAYRTIISPQKMKQAQQENYSGITGFNVHTTGKDNLYYGYFISNKSQKAIFIANSNIKNIEINGMKIYTLTEPLLLEIRKGLNYIEYTCIKDIPKNYCKIESYIPEEQVFTYALNPYNNDQKKKFYIEEYHKTSSGNFLLNKKYYEKLLETTLLISGDKQFIYKGYFNIINPITQMYSITTARGYNLKIDNIVIADTSNHETENTQEYFINLKPGQHLFELKILNNNQKARFLISLNNLFDLDKMFNIIKAPENYIYGVIVEEYMLNEADKMRFISSYKTKELNNIIVHNRNDSALIIKSKLFIDTPGEYMFNLKDLQGYHLVINNLQTIKDSKIISKPLFKLPSKEIFCKIFFQKGFYNITITPDLNTKDYSGIIGLSWKPPGYKEYVPVPQENLFIAD